MDVMPYIALIKETALAAFFLLYCGLLTWTFTRRQEDMEDLRWLPLREEEHRD
jgi:hypothetical protein